MIYATMILLILALIPPALIARTRSSPSPSRRIHVNLDMDLQGKLLPQDPSTVFADGRAARPVIENTLSREDYQLQQDELFYRGVDRGAGGASSWTTSFPPQTPVNLALLQHGQERFDIYCRPCHGYSGYGDGIVHQRAQSLLITGQAGTVWVQPKSLHDPAVRDQPPGQIFNTITHGVRNMAGYESQIPVADRWAIVAYVKALQLSQNATEADVPEDQREDLPTIKLPPGAPGGSSGGAP